MDTSRSYLTRREFLKGIGVAIASTAVPPWLKQEGIPRSNELTGAKKAALSPPASLGRIASWWQQAVRREPSPKAQVVAWKKRDDIIPLYEAVVGEAPWPTNPIWYRTDEGFIHSGYVQPVENQPNTEIISEVPAPGFWAQVCVPIAEARWKPAGPTVALKLYYGTVYRVVSASQDSRGDWWYRLKEGVTWGPGPYIPAWAARRIPPEELAPISPECTDKWIEIDREKQRLTCYEGERPVFSTAVSTGIPGLVTPKGNHRVLWKSHTSRMIGGEGADRYDLPGVAFPVYFTFAGAAIHGTYWHNDFGRRHSHGCVNVTNQTAQWIFRWTNPPVPYDEHTRKVKREDAATRIVVI